MRNMPIPPSPVQIVIFGPNYKPTVVVREFRSTTGSFKIALAIVQKFLGVPRWQLSFTSGARSNTAAREGRWKGRGLTFPS